MREQAVTATNVVVVVPGSRNSRGIDAVSSVATVAFATVLISVGGLSVLHPSRTATTTITRLQCQRQLFWK